MSEEERMKNQAIWFGKSDALDSEIRDAFAPLVEQGREGKLDFWQDTPLGTAALVVLLDQFSRNVFRKSPDSYSAVRSRGAAFPIPPLKTALAFTQPFCNSFCRDCNRALGLWHKSSPVLLLISNCMILGLNFALQVLRQCFSLCCCACLSGPQSLAGCQKVSGGIHPTVLLRAILSLGAALKHEHSSKTMAVSGGRLVGAHAWCCATPLISSLPFPGIMEATWAGCLYAQCWGRRYSMANVYVHCDDCLL